jgi:hypothetical protein
VDLGGGDAGHQGMLAGGLRVERSLDDKIAEVRQVAPLHVARAIVLTWLPNVIVSIHSAAGGPSNSKVVVRGARDSIFAGSAVARAARTGTAGRWSSSYAASSGVRKVSLSVDPHRRNKILLPLTSIQKTRSDLVGLTHLVQCYNPRIDLVELRCRYTKMQRLLSELR